MISLSVMFNLYVTPWTVVRQAPLSMGSSRQEYWSGLPFHPPDPGMNPHPCVSCIGSGDSSPLSHLGSLRFFKHEDSCLSLFLKISNH